MNKKNVLESGLVKEKDSDLIVDFIDIDLPGQSGTTALTKLRHRFASSSLVMLTQHESKDQLFKAFANGASGYLIKDFQITQLPKFILTVKKGGALISPQMARWIVEYFNPPKASHSDLTTNELQLLRLFAEGKSYEASAKILSISVNGVKYHVKNIYSKLNVNNKIDAIRAVKHRL